MKIFLLLLLASSTSGFFISSYCYYGNDWPVIGDVYTCEVEAIHYSGSLTHVTGHDTTHEDGHSDLDVKTFVFSCFDPDKMLSVIPKGLLDFFPNLIGLYFDSCPINSLKGDELLEYSSLQFYGQGLTNLTLVPGNFFAQTPHLRFVAFIDNQIQLVGEGLLDDLRDLQEVYFFEICLTRLATNPSEIASLINVLETFCSDVACRLDNLEAKNAILKNSDDVNKALKAQFKNLISKNQALKNQVNTLNEDIESLRADQENLAKQVENLIIENQEMLKELEHVTFL